MSSTEEPRAEGDSLWPFLKDCWHNVQAFHIKNAEVFELHADIDLLFRKARGVSCSKASEGLLPVFLGRAHAAYLAAVNLTLSGLVPECFMLVRGCIENSLYALHAQRDPSAQRAWLGRESSADARKQCRKTFTYRNVLESLATEDAQLKDVVDELYQESIDCGAHPNVIGHLATSQVTDWGCNVSLLDPTCDHWKRALIVIGEAGITALRVLSLIYGDRFKDVGISDRLESYS